jgi:hypothetical protein
METFETLREEVELRLRDALAARPSLAGAIETATRQAFDAAQQFESFCLRVARGTRHGQDELTPAVRRLLDEARGERDRAAGALTRAQRDIRNIDWSIECARAEIQQLELVANPPVQGRGPLYEIAERPPIPLVDVDNIVFPKPPEPAA